MWKVLAMLRYDVGRQKLEVRCENWYKKIGGRKSDI